jgi:glycosyltransferase involved in cell wall biosynthesis
MEKISVIVPIYNAEKYLDDCIGSIADQTYASLEIILVDDGSTDSCPSKCDEWARKDGRVKVIHQKNKGISGARNAGLASVSGKYLAFVDSDDIVHPEMLERLYKALTDDGCDLAVCDFIRFTDRTEIASFEVGEGVRTVRNARDTIADCTQLPRSELWGKLYKSELFEGISFKDGIVYEDTHVMPYLYLKADKISISDRKLYYYRMAEASIMHSAISKIKFCVFGIYREHIRLYTREKMYKARGYIRRELIPKTVKASIMCGEHRGLFYSELLKNLPYVVFAPPREVSLKGRLLFLSALVPLKPIRAHYEKISDYLHLDDTKNF